VDLWVALWLVSVGIVVVIPIMAWRGRPRTFGRIHWIAITVGAGFGAFIFLFQCQVALLALRPKWLTLLYLSSAQILIAAGIGSLLAMFFRRPDRE
jgi:hypothetical protein